MARVEALQPGRVCGLGWSPSRAPGDATSPAPGSPSAAPASAWGAKPRLPGSRRLGTGRRRELQLAATAPQAPAGASGIARMAQTHAARQVRPAPTAVRARRQPRRSGATTLKMPVQLAKATPAPHSVGLAGPGEAGEGLPVRPARLAGEFARRCACVLCAPARPRSCCAAYARRPLAAPRRRRGAARVRAGGTTVACCVSVEVTAHCKLLSQSGLGASSRSPCAQRCRAAPPLPLDCSLWRASRSANAPAGGAHQPNGRFRGIPWLLWRRRVTPCESTAVGFANAARRPRPRLRTPYARRGARCRRTTPAIHQQLPSLT